MGALQIVSDTATRQNLFGLIEEYFKTSLRYKRRPTERQAQKLEVFKADLKNHIDIFTYYGNCHAKTLGKRAPEHEYSRFRQQQKAFNCFLRQIKNEGRSLGRKLAKDETVEFYKKRWSRMDWEQRKFAITEMADSIFTAMNISGKKITIKFDMRRSGYAEHEQPSAFMEETIIFNKKIKTAPFTAVVDSIVHEYRHAQQFRRYEKVRKLSCSGMLEFANTVELIKALAAIAHVDYYSLCAKAYRGQLSEVESWEYALATTVEMNRKLGAKYINELRARDNSMASIRTQPWQKIKRPANENVRFAAKR